MSEIDVQATGHLTRDPELTFTPSGQQVAKFQIGVTPRKKQGDQWVDGETTFLPCEAWGDLGEHVAESLTRGAQVFVKGVLRTQRWKGQQGEDRERMFVRVDEVGPSLRFANAQVRKVSRGQAVQTAQQQLGGQVVGEEKAPF